MKLSDTNENFFIITNIESQHEYDDDDNDDDYDKDHDDESFRSSCPECFIKKGVFNNFAKFTGKHPRWRLFLIKLQVEEVPKILYSAVSLVRSSYPRQFPVCC